MWKEGQLFQTSEDGNNWPESKTYAFSLDETKNRQQFLK